MTLPVPADERFAELVRNGDVRPGQSSSRGQRGYRGPVPLCGGLITSLDIEVQHNSEHASWDGYLWRRPEPDHVTVNLRLLILAIDQEAMRSVLQYGGRVLIIGDRGPLGAQS